jgi:ADP-ribose pyrophosphatase YjhB (NUDIX family)
MTREYPDLPRVGVGAVVLSGERVLLVRRGGQPARGKWSLPGGQVELGETTVEAVERELAEECGLKVRVAGLAGVLDRVIRDADGRIRYQWVLVDYLAYPESETVLAGSDAAEARWVPLGEIRSLDVTDGLWDMIQRAVTLAGGGSA